MLRLPALAALLAGAAAAAAAPNPFPWPSPRKLWPPDAGVTDVTHWGAVGDGVTDDTQAIEAAWVAAGSNSRLYFPAGVYLVSRTLSPMAPPIKSRIVQGECTTCSTIRLADGAPGFGDATAPMPVVHFGAGVAQNFESVFMDITVDTGSNNPGAIGVAATLNNQGALRNVSIVSGDGGGVAGLGLGLDGEPGPMLVKYLAVSGFRWGVLIAGASASAVFEHLYVQGQSGCGFNNSKNVITIKGFTSNNTVPALCQGQYDATDGAGVSYFSTVVDAFLYSPAPAPAGAALVSHYPNLLFARNIVAHGYALAINAPPCYNASQEGCLPGNPTGSAPAPYVELWTSHPPLAQWPDAAGVTLNLTAPETPEPVEEPLAGWANALGPGGGGACTLTGPKNASDCTALVQAALDSGANTVYFPAGTEVPIWGVLTVPRGVRRIVGHATALIGNFTFLVADGGTADGAVIFETIHSSYNYMAVTLGCARDVVVWSVLGLAVTFVPGGVGWRSPDASAPGATPLGDVFVDDSEGMNDNPTLTTNDPRDQGWVIAPGQRAYTRQLDTESRALNFYVSPGALFWALGWKTEGGEAGLFNATRAAGVEIVGAFNYANGSNKSAPAITIVDTPMSIQWGGYVDRAQPQHLTAAPAMNSTPLATRPTRPGTPSMLGRTRTTALSTRRAAARRACSTTRQT